MGQEKYNLLSFCNDWPYYYHMDINIVSFYQMDNVKRSNRTVTKEKAPSYQLLVSNSQRPMRIQYWLWVTNHSPANVLVAFCLQQSPLCSVCCWFSASKYLWPFREFIFKIWITKNSKMVKTAKERTIHKAMRSADKFYSEIPGYYIFSKMFLTNW